MNNDDELMSAEEFFGEAFFDESDSGKMTAVRKPSAVGKKAEKDLLTEVKIKMVMRVYKVSRAKAAKIVAEKTASASESGKGGSEGSASARKRNVVDADDLFSGI